ncbi:MAG: hypothetical protein QOF91_3832 [Alphaproteobacteria bacterium]|jgi:hypothetical protein|nr:hypothetical protein [Alphaproteobacteria bacterium]MEA3028547.1 hypothetical protein [Alphaproteobacteria bacterium]
MKIIERLKHVSKRTLSPVPSSELRQRDNDPHIASEWLAGNPVLIGTVTARR